MSNIPLTDWWDRNSVHLKSNLQQNLEVGQPKSQCAEPRTVKRLKRVLWANHMPAPAGVVHYYKHTGGISLIGWPNLVMPCHLKYRGVEYSLPDLMDSVTYIWSEAKLLSFKNLSPKFPNKSPRQLKHHLLGWQAERRAWFQFVLVFFLPGVSRRPHPWPLLLVPLHPVPLPLFLTPHSLLLAFPLSFSLPLSLPTLPFTVVSLSLSVPVALLRVTVTFALLSKRMCKVENVLFNGCRSVKQPLGHVSWLSPDPRADIYSFT